jgi:hypothetical protein
MKRFRGATTGLCGLCLGWLLGWYSGGLSDMVTLSQATGGRVVLDRAVGNLDNTGRPCLALLTREREFLRLGGPQSRVLESPEGSVYLEVFRRWCGRLVPLNLLYLGHGARGRLLAADLTGDGETELFIFVDGQGTRTHVLRFSGRLAEDLLTIDVGRPEVECRRRSDGRYEIVEHGRLDWYDDVPADVARRAEALGKPFPNRFPVVARVYQWDRGAGRFLVHHVVPESPGE